MKNDSMGNLRRTGVKFGKDEKKGLVLTHNLAVPGPGAYPKIFFRFKK